MKTFVWMYLKYIQSIRYYKLVFIISGNLFRFTPTVSQTKCCLLLRDVVEVFRITKIRFCAGGFVAVGDGGCITTATSPQPADVVLLRCVVSACPSTLIKSYN